MQHLGESALGWFGANLMPKDSVSSCKSDAPKRGFEKSKENFVGLHKHPKIKFNHQIDGVILLGSVSQVTMLKHKYYAEIFYIMESSHCTHSSGDG